VWNNYESILEVFTLLLGHHEPEIKAGNENESFGWQPSGSGQSTENRDSPPKSEQLNSDERWYLYGT